MTDLSVLDTPTLRRLLAGIAWRIEGASYELADDAGRDVAVILRAEAQELLRIADELDRRPVASLEWVIQCPRCDEVFVSLGQTPEDLRGRWT